MTSKEIASLIFNVLSKEQLTEIINNNTYNEDEFYLVPDDEKIGCNVIDSVYYDARLAYSMHLMLEEDGKLLVLNHNSGVLFAKATENEDGSLNPKSIRYPYIHSRKEGGLC